MKIFEANITFQVIDLLVKKLRSIHLYELANESIFAEFFIYNFFLNQLEYEKFKVSIDSIHNKVSEPNRSEYGDFQTNKDLAFSITQFLKTQKKINPIFILEPTCGKGNFIIASLSTFTNLENIIGIEIYKPYTWETKFNIIDFYISNPKVKKTKIEILHFNVFEFDFNSLYEQIKGEILILGNPPWITNTKLSILGSNNLPQKTNLKKINGLDAITGKGNFDIGESITRLLLDTFQNYKGNLAFLVKNSVIKNIVFDQMQSHLMISEIEKLTIDSKKEFNVSVESSLLFCKLNSKIEYTCKEYNFYKPNHFIKEFGWVANKFVSNIELYSNTSDIDGICPIIWRQGIKHDLSTIMEIERINGHFINGKNEEIILEEDLLYGFLKSSDLKQIVINNPRKFTIVTQKKVGQDTTYIKFKYPKIFNYLDSNKSYFKQRKSVIYNNKPDFSIFGIGDYSFLPYKVAISGLYKTFNFSLILKINNKPLMLDDTCYLLGFETIEFAAYTTILLNTQKSKEFLQSITFIDAKRTFTKEVLMRIDIYKLALQTSEIDILKNLKNINEKYNLNISIDKWDEYLEFLRTDKISLNDSIQNELFSSNF